jgi:hypothetical protein
LISITAKAAPMHMRGPALKGLYSNVVGLIVDQRDGMNRRGVAKSAGS